MKRVLVVLAFLVGVAVALWLATGGIQRAVENRIEAALVAEGLPQSMAACIGERLADRLSLAQLRRIEGAMEGEAGEGRRSSASVIVMLERIRRIDDPEIIDVAGSTVAICALGGA